MEMTISPDSWHYQVYKWWKEFSGFSKSTDFKENLCHYMRVVLIWAPIGWFLYKRLWGNLRPWIVASVFAAIFGTGIGLQYFPYITLMFWAVYSGTLMSVGIVFGLVWVAISRSKLTACLLLLLLSPVMVPGLVLTVPTKFVVERVIIPIYFRRHRFLLAGWLVTLELPFFVIFLIWGVDTLITILGYIVVTIILTISGLLLLFLITVLIPEAVMNRKKTRSNSTRSPGGISTLGLLKAYRQTKWGSRICPYILLPHQWD